MLISEPANSRSYILNVSQITEHELGFAGERALNLSHLTQIGAPIPEGFVITSKTFDDFLFANDLISKIGSVNSQFTKGLINSKKAEVTIAKLINEGAYPNLVEESLIRAYNLLTNSNSQNLLIETSSLNSQLKDSVDSNPESIMICSTLDEFLRAIKYCWIGLFGQTAMEKRLESKYRGVLSTALVVTKFIQPETSGIAYTLAISDANPNIIELRAIYGISSEKVLNLGFPDRYLYDRKIERVLDKHLNNQPWMLVWNDKKITKLNLSKTHQNAAKLNDIQILKFSKSISKLKDLFKNELKINWVFRDGKFVFTNLSRLREQDVIDARKSLLEIDKSKGESRNTVEINPATERYNLQPLSKLTKLTGGHGNQRGLVYGRAKIIRNESDLDNISGINILVMKKLPKRFEMSQISYKGVVIQDTYTTGTFQKPLISNARDATNLLLENEIITLDTNTGNIYLGAGFLPVANEPKEVIVDTFRPETISAKEVTVTMQRPVTQGLFKTNLLRNYTSNSWLPEEVEKEEIGEIDRNELKKEVNNSEEEIMSLPSVNDEFYLKSPVFMDSENRIASSCRYLELINPENPIVILNTDGVFFKMSQILKVLDVDKYELIRNKHLRNKFIEFIAKYFEGFSKSMSLVISLDISPTSKELAVEDEILEFQLELIKFLKYRSVLNNISIVLPDLRTEKELITLKKQVTANGLRRSATFKLYTEIASPLAAISVGKIIDDGIDGIIVDLEKLLMNLGSDEIYKLSPEVTEFIVEIINKITSTTVPAFISADKISLNDFNLEKFLDSGVLNFIFPEAKITQLSPILANMEVRTLKDGKGKRGRKKKQINYGY